MKEKDHCVRTEYISFSQGYLYHLCKGPYRPGSRIFPAALAFDLDHRNCDRQPGRSAVGMSA